MCTVDHAIKNPHIQPLGAPKKHSKYHPTTAAHLFRDIELFDWYGTKYAGEEKGSFFARRISEEEAEAASHTRAREDLDRLAGLLEKVGKKNKKRKSALVHLDYHRKNCPIA